MNQEFVKLLSEVFGQSTVSHFREENGMEYTNLLHSFEAAKQAFRAECKSSRVVLPSEFIDHVSSVTGKQVCAHRVVVGVRSAAVFCCSGEGPR